MVLLSSTLNATANASSVSVEASTTGKRTTRQEGPNKQVENEKKDLLAYEEEEDEEEEEEDDDDDHNEQESLLSATTSDANAIANAAAAAAEKKKKKKEKKRLRKEKQMERKVKSKTFVENKETKISTNQHLPYDLCPIQDVNGHTFIFNGQQQQKCRGICGVVTLVDLDESQQVIVSFGLKDIFYAQHSAQKAVKFNPLGSTRRDGSPHIIRVVLGPKFRLSINELDKDDVVQIWGNLMPNMVNQVLQISASHDFSMYDHQFEIIIVSDSILKPSSTDQMQMKIIPMERNTKSLGSNQPIYLSSSQPNTAASSSHDKIAPSKLSKNYIYTRFELLQPGVANIYGVVVYITSITTTSGIDLKLEIGLVDPSLVPGDWNVTRLTIFGAKKDFPDIRRVGDIIRVHRVDVEIYQGKIALTGSKKRHSSYVVIDDYEVRSTDSGYHPLDNEKVTSLRRFRDSLLSSTIPSLHSNSYSKLLRDAVNQASVSKYFDCLCQVTQISDPPQLSSTSSSLSIHDSSNLQQQKASSSSSSITNPGIIFINDGSLADIPSFLNGGSMAVIIYDSEIWTHFERIGALHPGVWIKLRNVKIESNIGVPPFVKFLDSTHVSAGSSVLIVPDNCFDVQFLQNEMKKSSSDIASSASVVTSETNATLATLTKLQDLAMLCDIEDINVQSAYQVNVDAGYAALPISNISTILQETHRVGPYLIHVHLSGCYPENFEDFCVLDNESNDRQYHYRFVLRLEDATGYIEACVLDGSLLPGISATDLRMNENSKTLLIQRIQSLTKLSFPCVIQPLHERENIFKIIGTRINFLSNNVE